MSEKDLRSKPAGRLKPAFCLSRALKALSKEKTFNEIYRAAKEANVNSYLVGGVLRDIMVGRPPAADYDLAVDGDAARFSKALADRIGASAFVLDKSTSTYRVVMKGHGTIDVSTLKGGDIVSDVARRDFTVNAVAVSVDDIFTTAEPELIDPENGFDDARAGVLRVVYSRAFDDDPLRALRAVRLAQEYALDIERGTEALIKTKARLVADVSIERIRDELASIFIHDRTSASIRKLFDLDLVDTVLPESRRWRDIGGYNLLEHALGTLDEAEAILAGPLPEEFPFLGDRLAEPVSGRLRTGTVLKLAAFLHDSAKPLTIKRDNGRLRFIGHDALGEGVARAVLKRLKFARSVCAHVALLAGNHHRAFALASLKSPGNRARAHFFNKLEGAAGLELLCLALADVRATIKGRAIGQVGLVSIEELVSEMLHYYRDVYSKTAQKPLLSGREIIDVFGVEQGEIVGEIAERISEGVEAGVVRSKKGALEYINKWLGEKDR